MLFNDTALQIRAKFPGSSLFLARLKIKRKMLAEAKAEAEESDQCSVTSVQSVGLSYLSPDQSFNPSIPQSLNFPINPVRNVLQSLRPAHWFRTIPNRGKDVSGSAGSLPG